MFIQTEETPNPLTLKFLPGVSLLEQGTYSFSDTEEAARSPLVEKLFRIEGVRGVLLGTDFISVSKTDEKEWYVLKPSLLGVMMEHFVAGRPLFRSESELAQKAQRNEEDDPISREIREIIESRVRPAVAMDGGDILFDRFEDGIVYVQMQGACSGCPSSSATLKSGIENMLRHYVPEVLEVRSIES